jgi:TRAP-type transport system periplasmic protein
MHHTIHGPSRHGFVLGSASTLATIGIVHAPAKAAQFEIRCGSDFPPDHPTSVRLTQMWNAVLRESGGRIHTQYFPNSQLGNDAAMLTQLRSGVLHFFLISPANLAAVVPAVDISFLGFAYRDAAEGLHVMDGPLGTYEREQIASKGMYAMRTHWDSGMFQIGSNSHPIRNPDDLHSFKVRVPPSRITLDLFTTLGASPIPTSTAELYMALQTRLVDGESGPMVTIETQRWYEVNKYISLTNHQWSGLWLIVNADFWKSLPPDLQAVLERNNTKYALLERRDSKLANASVADKLARQGIVLNRVDQAPFRLRLKSYYETWAKEFGPAAWGSLEASLGHKLL